MTIAVALATLLAVCSLTESITVPGGPPVLRRQVLQPVRAVRIHRSGGVPLLRNVRVRNVPVKRIYVPMKVAPQPQRFSPQPVGVYKFQPQAAPQPWKSKDVHTYRQPQHVQPFRQHIPHNLAPQNLGPPRKARYPKPKYPTKYPKYTNKQPSIAQQQQIVSGAYDSYTPAQQSSYALVTDSYGAPKPANYRPYSKPGQLISSSLDHQQRKAQQAQGLVAAASKDEPATSYVNVYQGEKAKEEGTPTYGFTQSHSYEKKHKGTVYSDSEALVSNHRPVYKPKSDVADRAGSGEQEEREEKGSFTPPKQTFGFTPYEEGRREGGENYGPAQPAQQYYKKQPDTVLGPNYFEQGKAS